MSDPSRVPPPAPPLPPPRAGVLPRIAATLGFGAARPTSSHERQPSHDLVHAHSYAPLPSQTAAHRTGIPIAALDINGDKTHAVLAGKEILKTVRVCEGKVTEEFNLRSTISSYTSAHGSGNANSSRRRDFLQATDVKWSHKQFDTYIATAATNGRITLYDINKPEVELAWIHEHTRQVHKLAFDPHAGYLLLSGSHDGTARIWDMRTFGGDKSAMALKSFKQFIGQADAVRDVQWSPTDAFEFVMCTDSGVIQKWDIRNASGPKLPINAHEKACFSVDWHPDGRHVVSGGSDKYVKVWDFQGNRRQKPSFQLRAPQAIMHIRWRPASWSSEIAGTGQWQSVQLATSYYQDDPRVHIWDLRRPLLPFRELDRYNKPATGLLWASKDLLWTVGNEGMFQQTDVQYAPQVHHQLAPCTMDWFPDGEFATFSENCGVRRSSGLEDPAVGFLSVRHEKLSSGEEGALSHSLSDDEVADGLLSMSFKRRQSKGTSTKSGKSQNNTPPAMDGFPQVLSLDKAVFARNDLFNNKQVGVVASIAGVAAEPELVQYLAESYAQPIQELERIKDPETILWRLEEAFRTNADVCDEVSLHRTAQSWRILGAVIVPELKNWADKNRRERLARSAAAQKIKEKRDIAKRQPADAKKSPTGSGKSGNTIGMRQKATSNLLKGVLEAEKQNLPDVNDSTSNVTTPLARPLPDSPLSDHNPTALRFQNLDEAFEPLPPLPPSVFSAHQTAAVASQALQDNSSTTSSSAPSSPESKFARGVLRDQKLSETSKPASFNPEMAPPAKSSPQPIKASNSARKGETRPQRQEERRAALRDYRVQTRPLLSFDEPDEDYPQHAILAPGQRHDSTDSFLMFSASSGSSHHPKSMGDSSGSPQSRAKQSFSPGDWQSPDMNNLTPSSPPSKSSIEQSHIKQLFQESRKDHYRKAQLPDFGLDNAEDFPFGLDGSGESKEVNPAPETTVKNWADMDDKERSEHPNEGGLSSSPDAPFHFEAVQQDNVTKPRIHTFNPLRHPSYRDVEATGHTATRDHFSSTERAKKTNAKSREDEGIASTEYTADDFRPIDFTSYDPPTPFAWSALPLISQAIEFDVNEGIACAMFAVQLLLHIHPFYFHQSLAQSLPAQQQSGGLGLAERLMQPRLRARAIESILLSHVRYLQRMRLFVKMAEARKMCVEFGYERVWKVAGASGDDGTGGGGAVVGGNGAGASGLAIVCATCKAPMLQGANVCRRCHTARRVCPVCACLKFPGKAGDDLDVALAVGMWSFCHDCGHSAHFGCLAAWFVQPGSEGECPSLGCGCDCAPGRVRAQRIQKQLAEAEDRRALPRGSGSNAVVGGGGGGGGSGSSPAGNPRQRPREDTKRADESAAVGQVGRMLKDELSHAGGERDWHSGDERSSLGVFGSGFGAGRTSQSGASSGGGGPPGSSGGASRGKSVRLVAPGEERRRKR